MWYVFYRWPPSCQPWQSPAILPRRSKSSKGEKRSSFFLGFLQPLMASKSNTSGWFPHPLESELLSSRPKTRKTCEAILVMMISSWVGVPGIITFTLDVTHHNFHTTSLPTTTAAVSWAERVFKVMEPGYRFLVKWLLGCIFSTKALLF